MDAGDFTADDICLSALPGWPSAVAAGDPSRGLPGWGWCSSSSVWRRILVRSKLDRGSNPYGLGHGGTASKPLLIWDRCY